MMIIGSTFHNSTEVIDGKDYKQCEFHGSKLVYAGGSLPRLTECVFVDCLWQLDGAAMRTVQLLRSLYTQEGARPMIDDLIDRIRGQKPDDASNG